MVQAFRQSIFPPSAVSFVPLTLHKRMPLLSGLRSQCLLCLGRNQKAEIRREKGKGKRGKRKEKREKRKEKREKRKEKRGKLQVSVFKIREDPFHLRHPCSKIRNQKGKGVNYKLAFLKSVKIRFIYNHPCSKIIKLEISESSAF